MKKYLPLLLLLIIIVLTLTFFLSPLEGVYRIYFDWSTQQSEIISKKEIKEQLATLQKLNYKNLGKPYLKASQFGHKKFNKIAKEGTWYKVYKEDLFKYIVQDHRIIDFLPSDPLYHKMINQWNPDTCFYWLASEDLLFKTLALNQALEKAGHDPYGYQLISGFRHPTYNKKIGGASKSRHIHGQAVDIRIRDIDKNGRINQIDKKIVLDILEKKVIKDQGGIGRYPGTFSVHFDVRGYKARWDKQ